MTLVSFVFNGELSNTRNQEDRQVLTKREEPLMIYNAIKRSTKAPNAIRLIRNCFTKR